jgi:hypothetical protein
MPAEFEPTTDQRALVQNAAAFGINQADIANQLNIERVRLDAAKAACPDSHRHAQRDLV